MNMTASARRGGVVGSGRYMRFEEAVSDVEEGFREDFNGEFSSGGVDDEGRIA
ncbi:hypothetical protein ACFWTE_11350 [Nocardiopsis sp. NPDC058631]|uniref:hypothetical protein n=1 Tax=Nocardiopsis sp. NPDC058631 TaxID=3346566 RepID=UPI0036471E26